MGSKATTSVSGKLSAPLYSMAMTTLEGRPYDASALKGKVVLITNVACACGYTKSNYEQLVALDAKHKGELQILAFPSNEFGGQESGSPKQIRDFVSEKGVKFTMLEKTEVNGPGAHPVYQALKEATSGDDVKWNFETKFLVARDGVSVTRFNKVRHACAMPCLCHADARARATGRRSTMPSSRRTLKLAWQVRACDLTSAALRCAALRCAAWVMQRSLKLN